MVAHPVQACVHVHMQKLFYMSAVFKEPDKSTAFPSEPHTELNMQHTSLVQHNEQRR